MVWKRIGERFFPSRPHIPESALGYTRIEHRHSSGWIEGWLFLDEDGIGFVAQLLAEPLFYLPYTSLIRYNYNRLYQSPPPLGDRRPRRGRDLCFLRFHIHDPQLPVRCLDFRGQLEGVQALTEHLRRLAFGEAE